MEFISSMATGEMSIATASVWPCGGEASAATRSEFPVPAWRIRGGGEESRSRLESRERTSAEEAYHSKAVPDETVVNHESQYAALQLPAGSPREDWEARASADRADIERRIAGRELGWRGAGEWEGGARRWGDGSQEGGRKRGRARTGV